MRIISTIKAAIPYLHNPEVRKELDRLLEVVDRSLENVGYTMEEADIDAIKFVEEAMNNYDDDIAEQRRRAKRAGAAAMAEENEEEEEK